MRMKRYNIINNSLGWLCFIIAAVTYLLTLEPTASFWDCPEFILQGYKLEIGHPPGNPIFMLAARFFTNFAFGDVTKVALMVNAMSGLLSAATILLLFWTITHLVKRLTVADDATEVSPLKMLVIFGSGICGALMYAWSDTFWFSAVEGEVYAFSSFCTALVFWLILKWENRADLPHSDKYLVFIAYVIGISIAVHLLNLLCIPAIVLVVYYKKFKNPTGKGSLMALLVSFVIVGLILYGLVPGFIKMAQRFELACVNGLGMSFNSGTLIYALVLVASFCWTIFELYRQSKPLLIRISFILSMFLSGIFWIGHGTLILFGLTIALAIYMFTRKIPVRILNVIAISVLVIFVGYSSYALLLIRSSAHTPMNQNAPDNVFALATYLNREQYGERPLIYGETFESQPVRDASGSLVVTNGEKQYAKKVKTSPADKDEYYMYGEKKDYKMSPELNMLFPRIYSGEGDHKQAYSDWIGGLEGNMVQATTYVDENGNSLQTEPHLKPTFGENFRFFMNYQLNHMYWRYFMWNFAGRQNDIQGNGEVNHGNWISGIPFIDNPRLGDQSLLPYDDGEGNAGHNVFFLLPLIMGIIGLGWQAFTSKRGIEQFWVVFFLFFMTGIAIVIYLNQTPGQPRERDYAFAGSFYAYAIWVGMGVAGLWRLILAATRSKKEKADEAIDNPEAGSPLARKSFIAAAIAAVVGLIVPLQVVSQTWDDHDRSGRYAARDFGMNYLNSLDKNAIIFTYGDNDTFPLWYAQEVEGVRTDVKVVNLSYLTTDWYVNQIRRPSYDAPGIELQAKPADYAYGDLSFAYIVPQLAATDSVSAIEAVREIYSPAARENQFELTLVNHPRMYLPFNLEQMVKGGHITESDLKNPLYVPVSAIPMDFTKTPGYQNGLYLNNIMALDMMATSAANGCNRPVYFAMTVPDRSYMGLSPFMRSTGLAYEVTPLMNRSRDMAVNTDKMYANVTERFQWGGLDKVTAPGQVYLDETVRRMVTTNRSAMLDLAIGLVTEAELADSIAGPDQAKITAYRNDRYTKARNVLNLMREKLPVAAMPFAMQVGAQVADLYNMIGKATGNKADTQTAREILRGEIDRFTTNVLYYQSLSPSQYQSLQNSDRYIDMIYYLDLIDAYRDAGGDTDKLVSELGAKGVDLNRQLTYRQQAASRQAATEQAAQAEE